MKILVAVSNYYPTEKVFASFYERNRNIYYKELGAEVNVLNFSAKEDYVVDGMQVFSPFSIKRVLEKTSYDILVCHAANVRNHYIFLKRYEKKFENIVFIYHGQEIVKLNEVYPEPYKWNDKSNIFLRLFRNVYDEIKIFLWTKFHHKLANKSHYIFVSKSLYNEFIYFTNIEPKLINDRMSIIHNGVGQLFEKESYSIDGEKEFDFITIRSNLDSSVYCLDIINELAGRHPNCRFLVIGMGNFFEHESKPENIVHISRHMDHEELKKWIDKSKCALMPTRRDTQGVMSCELATYGIPLISSDIPICREILGSFENVSLISNFSILNLNSTFENLLTKLPVNKVTKYFAENTSGAEYVLFKKLGKEKKAVLK